MDLDLIWIIWPCLPNKMIKKRIKKESARRLSDNWTFVPRLFTTFRNPLCDCINIFSKTKIISNDIKTKFEVHMKHLKVLAK